MTLTRLSADLIGLVAHWLASSDVKSLLDSGNRLLRSRIIQGVTEIDCEILSLDVFPSWAFKLPHLRSLRVASPLMNSILSPVDPSILDFLPHEPSALQSIQFAFFPAMRILQPAADGRTLASVCSHLTSLKLATTGGMNKQWLRNLPPKLLVLHLNSHDVHLEWDARDLALLPQTLVEIKFLGEDTIRATEHIAWPPNLTSIEATVDHFPSLISSLPSCVEHINCAFRGRYSLLVSTLPSSLQELVVRCTLESLIFDAPLPSNLRLYSVDADTYFNSRNEKFVLDLDTESENFLYFSKESVAQFASFLPRSLETLKIATTVPLLMAAEHLPQLRYWNTRITRGHPLPPQWSFEEAQESLLRKRQSAPSDLETAANSELPPVHDALSPQFAHLQTFDTMKYSDAAHQRFFWGSLLPRCLTSFSGPIVNESIEQLIIISGVRLQILKVDWSVANIVPLSFNFLAHLGSTLKDLSAPLQKLDLFSTSFLDHRPLSSFNLGFEVLRVSTSGASWSIANARRFWNELPLPHSMTTFAFAADSKALTQIIALNADWSLFTKLNCLIIATLPDDTDSIFGDSYDGDPIELPTIAEIDLREREEGVTEATHFVGAGTDFKFFDTLPASLQSLSCFVPMDISKKSLEAIPRRLKTANLYFIENAQLFSWTFDHWRVLPPKLARLAISGALLDASSRAAVANGYDKISFAELLPAALLAINVRRSGKLDIGTRAIHLMEKYFSPSFWEADSAPSK